MPIRMLLAITASLLLVAIAGCSAPPDEPTSDLDSSSPAPAAAVHETVGTPVEFTCDNLFPASNLATLPHSWVLDHTFDPADEPSVSGAIAMSGIACGLTGSKGEKLVVTLAEPSAPTRATTIYDISMFSEAANDLGSDLAYFSEGTADIFPTTHWVSLSSPAFETAADAKPLADVIRQALPQS